MDTTQLRNTKEFYGDLQATLTDEQSKILLELDDAHCYNTVDSYELGMQDGIKQGIKKALNTLIDLV